jgi:hypothetical protein
MLLNPITAASKAPEKLTILFKCAFLVIFLIIMTYLSRETGNKQIVDPTKGFIRAPMNNAGSGSLRALQPTASQRSPVFTTGSSN